MSKFVLRTGLFVFHIVFLFCTLVCANKIYQICFLTFSPHNETNLFGSQLFYFGCQICLIFLRLISNMVNSLKLITALRNVTSSASMCLYYYVLQYKIPSYIIMQVQPLFYGTLKVTLYNNFYVFFVFTA
jgi:hypothetical protein